MKNIEKFIELQKEKERHTSRENWERLNLLETLANGVDGEFLQEQKLARERRNRVQEQLRRGILSSCSSTSRRKKERSKPRSLNPSS